MNDTAVLAYNSININTNFVHPNLGSECLPKQDLQVVKEAIQSFNMKYLMQVFFVSIMLLASTSNTIAQNNPYYTTEAEVIEAAYEALDNSMSFGGALNGYKSDYGWTGSYTFNITLKGKGEVVEVSSAGSNGSLQIENQLKGILEEMTFPFKMPQDANYKFKYEFKF